MENVKTILGWIIGPYKENPRITVICIYVACLMLGTIIHLTVKHLVKETEPSHGTATTIQQNSGDQSACTNIAAGRDANVNCPSTEKGK